jgi:transposase-like protein
MGKRTALVEETVASVVDRAFARHETQPVLDALLRAGATRLLQAALELEVEQYLERLQTQRDGSGRRLVVRNGHHRARTVLSSSGPVPVRQPRVHDRRPGERFTSAILPPYLRRTPSLEALIPTLYLKGVSTSDFPEALEAILGPGVGGLSSANIVRLKRVWEDEFAAWSRRRLEGKRYVYWWADAVYFQVRLSADRPCVLVLVGATEDGRKELLAVHDGERESELSWRGVLEDLKARGLTAGPALATGDRALGFWKALAQVYPAVQTQQCWVHKTANLLDKLPKKVQPDAKRLIHEMYMAPTRKDADRAYGRFLGLYEARYPKVAECLRKDQDVLFTFYDFPAAHWVHLRTTNPIESAFATVRHRARQTHGCGSRTATLTMVYKLATAAEKAWRRLHQQPLLLQVLRGDRFEDGELKEAA